MRLGYQSSDVARLQSALSGLGYAVEPDGVFGSGTEAAVRAFQARHGLVVDGIAGRRTMEAIVRASDPRSLQASDFEDAAAELGVEVAAIKAVCEVESSGGGFIGKHPKVLFERHIFRRRLKDRDLNPDDFGRPDLIHPSPGGYRGGAAELDRLRDAMRINEDAALESASWGLFQIMGFHWERLGYESAKAFVHEMYRGEREHLMAFVKFIQANGLDGAMRAHDWAAFARGYNGPAYRRNRYDTKMAAAYLRHSDDREAA